MDTYFVVGYFAVVIIGIFALLVVAFTKKTESIMLYLPFILAALAIAAPLVHAEKAFITLLVLITLTASFQFLYKSKENKRSAKLAFMSIIVAGIIFEISPHILLLLQQMNH